MPQDNQTVEIDGITIREGTAIFDTKFNRVLWLSEIGDYEIKVEVAESYKDDDPIWWSTDGGPTQVADGSRIGIDKLQSLIEMGRFEIGPQPFQGDAPR